MKMIPVLIILPLLATASWAYAPDCNVTRGIYVHARHLMPTEVWAKWASGYEIVKEQPHSGEYCLKAVNEPGDAGQGAGQSVELNQKKAEPLKISGWSRAEGVAGEKGYEYSIYVDLQFIDGEGWPMKIAAFETGTHDWEYSELIIEPEKPLKSARFHVFIRNIGGTVWFDDLFFGPPDGENLLQSPGFEKDLEPDTSVRDEIFDTYQQLHANAIHTYTSLPADEDGEKNLRGMLEAAKARGMGVVVTPHVYTAPVQSADDPDFPQWNCVLGDWGDRWVEALGGYAQYDFMGISLVPDEYNWTTGRFKRAFAKHKDDTVREFYENIPNYCDCPVCRERFQEMYGEPMPEMGKWSRPPEQTDAYRKWIDFRYRATTDWIRRSAEAIKSVNPAIRTDSLICVSPICSWHYVHISGQSGASQGETSFNSVRGVYDLLERVDPWLSGATALRRVALLYSRASEEYFSFYTHPEPSAILTHATDNLRYPFLAQKEVLYYLFRRGIPTDLYFLDQVSAEELADYPTIVVPFAFAAGEQQLDLLTQLAEAGKSVLIISEFGTVDELGAPLDAPALLELCGLAAAPTGEKQGALTFAADSVVLPGETLDGFTVYESVQPAEGARVLATVDGVPAVLERSLGSGRVVFLAGEFGIGLPANYDNEVRGREVRVLPSELSVAQVTVMDALLDELSPGRASLIGQAPAGKDLEVAAMRNAAGDLLLFAINWEGDPQSCEVALPEGCAAQGAGFSLESTGAVSEAQAEARQEAGELRLSLDLEGQEARVLRFAAE